jgi:hypothetical protein
MWYLMLIAVIAGILIYLVIRLDRKERASWGDVERGRGNRGRSRSSTRARDGFHVSDDTPFGSQRMTSARSWEREMDGVVDPVTGRPLHGRSRVFRCVRCRVFYQQESFDSLPGVRCVSCGHQFFISCE